MSWWNYFCEWLRARRQIEDIETQEELDYWTELRGGA